MGIAVYRSSCAARTTVHERGTLIGTRPLQRGVGVTPVELCIYFTALRALRSVQT